MYAIRASWIRIADAAPAIWSSQAADLRAEAKFRVVLAWTPAMPES